ncbi:hypothetical protein N7456_013256 [Penicillium angulare]|uniref:Rho GTPase activation protein n=1 Tax=Penicillium angulare TaxID=116970 RepID=A0A9W9ELC9_9EURO|nr:hypothetical protein N7456_013256 [Penicillium angulare]
MSQWRGNEDDLPSSIKNQPPSHQALNSLIPRDYLGARSEVASRPGAPGSRHISPSPLHTSSLPKSRLQDSPSSSPLSPRSSTNPSPSQNSQNHSPISRIANAPFPAPPSHTGHNMSQSPEMVGSDSDSTPRPSHGGVSKSSAAAGPDRSASSSVSSILSAPGERPTHRVMPRTSSIDSAISSLSSASQKSTFDANALSPTDIANLINAAGSAEAVIVHLLREKHQAASQNSQLWKLVDKQRTLILGLNKDLERAFKEKREDLQDSTPPVPTANPIVSQSIPREAGAPYGQMKSGLGSEYQNDKRQVPQPTIVPPSSASRVASNDMSPTSNLSSPVGSDGQKLPHPSRKPPPAPLDLRLGSNTRSTPVDPDSESDYGDSQEDTSNSDRGRRKTREEDDRDREAVLVKEASLQGSGTVRMGSSPSSQDTATSASPENVPRELSTRSPPNVGASGSLGSILNARATPSASNGRPSFPIPKSAGLPLSPRPEDRPLGSPLPRMPRDINAMAGQSMTAGTNLPGLPLSPRASNYPPYFAPVDAQAVGGKTGGPIPTIDPAVLIDSPRSPRFAENGIYQGLVSDEYPGLLLPPNALPVIQVQVSSSRLRPSRNSYMTSRPLEEEPVFTLSVVSRSNLAELWRVEKVIASLPQLDQQIRQSAVFASRLPDRSLFSGHSPAKVDARRAALNAYFDSLLDTPMDEKAALAICQFLTNDAIEPRDDETSLLKGEVSPQLDLSRGPDGRPRKEGYLTKRGKNFGGWKARYFVLQGPELRYFESPGGPHMGTIKLNHAQIGKQSQTPGSNSPSGAEEDVDNQYRHAFLVLEPKRKDSSALVRHVLCAESDDERDRWVEALMEHVESPSSDNDSRGGSTSAKSSPHSQGKQQHPAASSKPKLPPVSSNKKPVRGPESPEQENESPVQGFSFDDTVAAEPPTIGASIEQAPRSPRIPGALSTDFRDLSQAAMEPALQSPKLISGPTNGSVIQDVGAWGNKPPMTTKEKKRSIWGFRTRSSFDLASQAPAVNDLAAANNNAQPERKDPVRPVFGIPLAEAVQYCGPLGLDAELPAVVYRCIEYLHAKNAASEEGIFRLSGSNVVIKALKERFNTEGDVNFLAGDQYYDVHAVASLFKQYLRELPTTVLTRELHLDFLRVLELDDKQKKVNAFQGLVHLLPRPNLMLLRALSLFLIEIVNNSDVNKMTVRNVGIVFAPTLNIPAPVFSMFLTDFESIFGDTGAGSGPGPAVELTVEHNLTPDDIRSPRHQMFSDIPTPSYNQTSFRGTADALGGPAENSRIAHDTGFAPMQPSYDQPAYRNDAYNQSQGVPASYGSLNGMLSPGSDDTRSAKTKRRESSMLFMDSTQGDYSFYQDK